MLVGNAGGIPRTPLTQQDYTHLTARIAWAKERATTCMISLLRKTIDDSIKLSA